MTRDLRLVALALFIWGIGEGMFFYFQPLYIQELGAEPLEIGAILGGAGLAMTLAHIPAGALADLIGRKHLMTLSWGLGMLAGGMMFLARGLPVFVAGLYIYSFTAFVIAPLSSYITAARDSWTVSRALTTVYGIYSAGAVLGPILGGELAERLGLRPVYGVASALFLVSTVVILIVRTQPIEPRDASLRYGALLRDGRLLRFLLLVSSVAFALYLSWPLTPNFLQEVRGLSLSRLGLVGALNALGGMALNLTLGRLAPRRAYLISQAMVGASVILIWQGTGLPWFALGYFLAGGFRTSHSLVSAQVETLVRRREIGLAYGLAETVQSAAIIAAPPLAGWLFSIEPSLPYPVSLGLISSMLVISSRLAPRSDLVTSPGDLIPPLGRMEG